MQCGTALNIGVLITSERAVAIGGNASDVIITTGDQNIVFSFKCADAATVRTALQLGGSNATSMQDRAGAQASRTAQATLSGAQVVSDLKAR